MGCGVAEAVTVWVEAAVVKGVRRRKSDKDVRACIWCSRCLAYFKLSR